MEWIVLGPLVFILLLFVIVAVIAGIAA